MTATTAESEPGRQESMQVMLVVWRIAHRQVGGDGAMLVTINCMFVSQEVSNYGTDAFSN
jgi:hypothetical protein